MSLFHSSFSDNSPLSRSSLELFHIEENPGSRLSHFKEKSTILTIGVDEEVGSPLCFPLDHEQGFTREITSSLLPFFLSCFIGVQESRAKVEVEVEVEVEVAVPPLWL